MKVLFRTDASIEIGSGHVMRCITLAEGLEKEGAFCKFICRDHQGNLNSIIEERGFEVEVLKQTKDAEININRNSQLPKSFKGKVALPEHSSWLGVSSVIDAQQTINSARKFKFDWLVVDHYSLEINWQISVKEIFNKLMVIDDLADRPHVCDLLLDQNLGTSKSDYLSLVPKKCKVLVGPEFALLKPEFKEMRPFSLRRRREAKLEKLLINMGGTDKDNITARVLHSLQSCDLPNKCEIIVILGANSPWQKEVKNKALEMPWKTHVKVNVKNMAKEMAYSDMIIGAAGATSWERCSLGIPSILLAIANHQLKIASALKSKGAAEVINIELLDSRLNELFSDQETLLNKMTKISKKASEVTNGGGTSNVTKLMKKLIK